MYYHSDDFGCIYFLEHLVLPQTGFISADSIYKTTDGGYTWHGSSNWGIVPNNFAFKNKDTGWACFSGGLLKTTDGGKTWSGKPTIPNVYDVFYDQKCRELFINGDFEGFGLGLGIWASSDDGATWTVASGSNGIGTEAFSFWNDDTGIAAPWPVSSSWGIGLTTDGGKTWNPVNANAGDNLSQILSIPGTTTGFAIDEFGVVRRTDDLWHTARAIYHFPPDNVPGGVVGPSNMCITGTLRNLYVTLSSGCYRSTDQGISWQYLCGPGRTRLEWLSRFYADDNRVFTATEYYGTHFWMLNVDSMQYFPTGIQFPSGIKDTSVLPGSHVTVNFFPETTDPISIDSGRLAFRFDPNVLGLAQMKLPSQWQLLDSSESNGILRIHFLASDSLPNPILQLIFNTYLSPESSNPTKVYLDSASLFGHRLNCDCQALSILRPDSISHSAPDSVQINFLMACGDSTILAAMEHQPPFSITSVVPNPASTALAVTGTGVREPGSDLEFQLFDALGNCVLTQHHPLSTLHFETTLNVSELPSGIYFLRINSGGYAVSRSVSIDR